MISIYEAPRDAALPQLATVLDIAAMRAIFQAVYFTGEHSGTEIQTVPLRQTDRRVFQLQACQIERVKYKPGRNCLICYRLQFYDPQTGARDEQILSARVYPLGRSASRFRKAQARLLVQPKIGPPLLHLPALGMVAWGFPNDRKLTGLGRLMDPLCNKNCCHRSWLRISGTTGV